MAGEKCESHLSGDRGRGGQTIVGVAGADDCRYGHAECERGLDGRGRECEVYAVRGKVAEEREEEKAASNARGRDDRVGTRIWGMSKVRVWFFSPWMTS
jgi:hypothetical protein